MLPASAPVGLEKSPWNNSNGLRGDAPVLEAAGPWLDPSSCVPGTFARNRRTGQLRPFRCGVCPDCRAQYARAFTRGAYRAIRAFGLTSMLTLTLPSSSEAIPARARRFGTFHGPETARDVVRARRAAGKALNRFKARLRRRGILGDDLWVEEAHADGTPHLHAAFNDAAVRAAFGNDWAKVRAFLQAIAFDSGFGFLDWNVGMGKNPRAMAAELTKYLGKTFAPTGKGRPPWRDVEGCTVDGGFQKPRFHRWGGSRAAARIVRAALRPGPRPEPGEWELVSRINGTRPGECPLCGRRGTCYHRETNPEIVHRLEVRYVAWSPGRSVAIEPTCTFHFPDPSLPFTCHHEGLETRFGCGCNPPWLFELPWTPADLTARLAATEPVLEAGAICEPWESGVRLIADRRGARAHLREAMRDEPDLTPETPPPVVVLTRFELFPCTCRLCAAAGAGCGPCPRCAGTPGV